MLLSPSKSNTTISNLPKRAKLGLAYERDTNLTATYSKVRSNLRSQFRLCRIRDDKRSMSYLITAFPL